MRTAVKSTFSVVALSATLVTGIFIGQAVAQQPHMRSALDDLRAAKGELQAAMANKGGHRIRAIGLVNDAIAQVQMGIDAGE
jgi:hypothetical protein